MLFKKNGGNWLVYDDTKVLFYETSDEDFIDCLSEIDGDIENEVIELLENGFDDTENIEESFNERLEEIGYFCIVNFYCLKNLLEVSFYSYEEKEHLFTAYYDIDSY